MTVPVALDRRARLLDGGRVLLGGDPGRLVRLRAPLPLPELTAGQAGPLAERLVDAGLAHPRPVARTPSDVVVVVPVRDRVDELDACLTALGPDQEVLVVDDASVQAEAVAEVCRRHRARLLRLPRNGGPAAARNAGTAASGGALVAYVDSDCLVPEGWLDLLVGHFDDPRVAAVAPRVQAVAGAGLLGRYAAARGPLDLGPDEARVRPGGRVPYVPTAALVVRRANLPGPAPFDDGLRYGEDVDLVWRLHDQGGRVRYDPRVVVRHQEPARWRDWLARRHHYGTSAAPLAARHRGRLAPLVLPPWPTACWLLLTCGQPAAASAAAAVPALRLHRRLRASGLPRQEAAAAAARATASAVVSVAAGFGGAGTAVTGPVLLGLLLRRRTRATALLVLLTPPLVDHVWRRPRLDAARWSVLRLADDLAYASGVWRGAARLRDARALRPRTTRPV